MNKILLGLALASVALPIAGTAEAQSNRAARIPFANHGGIRDFQPVSDSVIFIQATGGRWYRAELMAPCSGMQFRNTLGFGSDPDGSFTKFSSIRSRGMNCQVRTLSPSGPPPRKSSLKR